MVDLLCDSTFVPMSFDNHVSGIQQQRYKFPCRFASPPEQLQVIDFKNVVSFSSKSQARSLFTAERTLFKNAQ